MSAQAQSKFVDIHGIPIHYQEAGAGTPIVFVHGWSLDYSCWQAQVDYFSQHYRTIAYDWRGSGKSGGAKQLTDFTQLVEELDALLAALALERPILCGHSMGGDMILEYAVTYPQRLSALVVADTPGPHNITTSPLASIGVTIAVEVLKFFSPKKPLKCLVPICQRLFYSKRFQKSHPEVITAWQKQFVSNSVAGLLHSSRVLANRKVLGKTKLSQVAVPTLFLVGSKDKIVSRRETEAYQQSIPGSQMTVIKKSGHMTLQEQVQVFNQTMEAFLSSLKQ